MHAQESASTAGVPKRPAILFLHGSGGHIDFWTSRLAPLLAESQIGFYAPQYFDRTNTSRADLHMLTDGVHVPQWLETVDDALRYVAVRPGVDPERIVLAGISLGAFLALALAAQLGRTGDPQQAKRIRALLEISGGLVQPYDAFATSTYPPTLLVHGDADTVVPVRFAHDLDRRLTELKVPHRTEILAGEGHWFSGKALPYVLMAVSAFLEPLLHNAPERKTIS